MKFVSFSDTSNDRNYTYSYTKRGTKELYYPDNKRERIDGNVFISSSKPPFS